jgi:hypothetical protein
MLGSLGRLADHIVLFRFLFDNHPVPMWVFDAGTMGFLKVNDAAGDQGGVIASVVPA